MPRASAIVVPGSSVVGRRRLIPNLLAGSGCGEGARRRTGADECGDQADRQVRVLDQRAGRQVGADHQDGFRQSACRKQQAVTGPAIIQKVRRVLAGRDANLPTGGAPPFAVKYDEQEFLLRDGRLALKPLWDLS
jgi:hypothetical protein